MSLCRIKVSKLILREHFGENAEKIGGVLLDKGTCNLRQIASETATEINKVRKLLSILIQQNLVKYEKTKRGITEYWVDTDMVLWRQRIPNYIFCAKSLYGDSAELLIEELLQHGQVLMSKVTCKVTDKLNEALANAGHQKISSSFVYEKFSCLAKTHFIQRCPNLMEESETDVDERELSGLYIVPPFSNADRKRKHSTDESDIPSKKQKLNSGEEKASDDGIYWKVNNDRFHQYFRDQLFVKAICKKIDKRAGSVLQTMLRISEVRTEDISFTSSPMSFTEIFQGLPKDEGMTKSMCEQYLTLMADDSTCFISKIGDSGGGMYCVKIMKALETLCRSHLESVVQERFGSKSLRIFKVLVMKKHLEQKQIEEMAMIPAKEAKELLYNMFAQKFVTITEISKTPDHAPARTYYLFRVNIEQLARLILEHCYKAMSNVLLKREAETKENRRLMEKQERVDAILSTIEDDTQKEEILQTITPAENTQLSKLKHMLQMLEQSELQLHDTIFVLEMFLAYQEEKRRCKM